MLTDGTSWDADVEALVDVVANGELAARLALAVGERLELSQHEGPGLLSEGALRELSSEPSGPATG
jgi:hypothetical protein